MKKILSLVLAALMVFSVLPAAFATDDVVAISEVEEVSEYQEAIDFLKLLGIYKGNGTGDAADELVTRWQMALFVSRFVTGKVDSAYWATTENDSGFTDVEDFEGASEESLGAISFASQKGIVNGIGDGLFDPETGVQYREAITMIVRALGYTYKASGYPWSYINKAREMGLLDGITGVAYTDQINRDVVAQLLYNALFAEIDGANVAENVFNVGQTVVLITASNTVAYTDEDKVLRTNYVRFTELDVQGEPTGASYHVDMAKFGLADAAAANAAVGTPYFVYYVNGCADIIYAESLSTVVENRGDAIAVSTSASGGRNYLTIDGSKYQIVSQYNELNKLQSWNQDAAGTDQVKVYQAYGAQTYTASSKYIIDSFNNVYVVDPTNAYGYSLYAQYSAVMDCYYRIDANGKWELLDLEDILKDAGSIGGAFKQLTSVNGKLAYADFVVSDASMDGYADRVTVKQYGFGKISYDKRKNNDNKDQETFNIKWVDEGAYATLSTNKMDKELQKTYASNKSTGYPFTTEFRWTGMARANVPNNAYVLFYVDEINKEVDILEVIDTDSTDGTYTVSGYLRGYDVAKDQIYLDADYTAYNVGYDNLLGSPLKDKTTTSTANNNLQNNINLIQPLMNSYIKLIIVDNKVVHIDSVSAAANYVILDSFVSFDEDGIVANAYTTVDDAYTQIKISAYNGWTVGGFDYYLYFLSGLFQGTANNYANILPVQLDTLYQVVYVNDGVYNLTNPQTLALDDALRVNQYGYIEGTDGKGALAAGKYVATNANDYWLILDEVNDTVYSYNGILNPIVDFANVAVYKCKENDYVIVSGTGSTITGLNNLSGKTTQFMMFNTLVSGINNATLFVQSSPYDWNVLMKDVLTGTSSMVKIDSKLVSTMAPNWDGRNYAQIGLVDGAIYTVIDGVLYQTTGNEKTFADVAAFYHETSEYDAGVAFTVTSGTKQADIKTIVARQVVGALFDNWGSNNSGVVADFAKKVTVYAQELTYNYLTNNETQVNNILAAANKDFVVNFVYKKDGTAVAWISAGTTASVSGALTQTVGKIGEGIDHSTATDTSVADVKAAPAVSYTYDVSSKTLVVTVDFTVTSAVVTDADISSLVWVDSIGVDATGVVTADAEGKNIATIVATYTGVDQAKVDALSEVHVLIERASNNEIYYEFTK